MLYILNKLLLYVRFIINLLFGKLWRFKVYWYNLKSLEIVII